MAPRCPPRRGYIEGYAVSFLAPLHGGIEGGRCPERDPVADHLARSEGPARPRGCSTDGPRAVPAGRAGAPGARLRWYGGRASGVTGERWYPPRRHDPGAEPARP